MGQATLMFGIGATKAGTSWLYRYLDAHPDCAMPAVKELHYFDSNTPQKAARQARNIRKNADRVENRGKGEHLARELSLKTRADRMRSVADMLQAPRDSDKAYTDHMQSVAGDAALVGDVTPAYALLSAKRLAEMAALAPVTRFVYILRDPIDRLWSNVRMNAGRKQAEGENLNALSNQLMEEALAGGNQGLMARSDYDGALTRLENAVPESSRLVLFFEQLFSEATLRRLCAFLGISYRAADTEKKIHAGHPVTLRPDLKQAAYEALKDQYSAVERRFGAPPVRWQRNMAKVSG